MEAFGGFEGMVGIWGKLITNLHLADDIFYVMNHIFNTMISYSWACEKKIGFVL